MEIYYSMGASIWATLGLGMIAIVSHVPVLVTCKPLACELTGGRPVKAGYWPYWTSTQNANFAFQNHVLYAFAQVEQINATTFQLVAPALANEFPDIARSSNLCARQDAPVHRRIIRRPGCHILRDGDHSCNMEVIHRQQYCGGPAERLRWPRPRLGVPGSQQDEDNFSLFLQEWRVAVNAESKLRRPPPSKPLLLTGKFR